MRSALNYSNKLFTRFKHGMSPKDIYKTHEFKASLDELEFDGYYMTRTKDATQAIQLAGNDVTNLINRALVNHGYQPLISELTSTNRFNDVSYDKAFTKLVPELKQYDIRYRSWYSQQMSLINSPETKALKKIS